MAARKVETSLERVEADKLFDLGRGEAEVSVRQRLLEGGASTGECIS
jgi:hypothetical protein